MAIQNPFLAKSSCSRQSFTHFARDFNLLQGNNLGDANDANHKQIKQDDQSSSMNMLRAILEYAFNTQSQNLSRNQSMWINQELDDRISQSKYSSS